ncbi:MAG: TonB-dependent receptor [Deltaproteobacteria bacterium]|nr:TonB-dependent receptor [Deltaproteobacteria bacterium]
MAMRHAACSIMLVLACTLSWSTALAQEESREDETGDAGETGEQVYETEDVVVTGTRTKKLLKDAPIKTELIRADEIEAKGAVNLLDAIEFRPGIRIDNVCSVCNTTGVKISGLPSRYTLMLIDGMPMYSSLGTTYGLLSLPASEIERIEIVKGANSILYGTDAIGGVINVITRKPGKDAESQLSVEGGMFLWKRAMGYTSFRKGDFGLTLTGTFATQASVDRDGDQVSEMTGYDQGSFAGTAYWDIADDINLTLRVASVLEKRQGGGLGSFLEVLDDQRRSFSESILTRRFEGGGRLDYQILDWLRSETILSSTYHYQDSDYEGEVYEADQLMLYAQEAVFLSLADCYHLVGGLSYRLEKLDENLAEADYVYHMPGVFVQGDWEIIEDLEFVHGARFDYHDHFGAVFTPRGAFKYALTDELTLRAVAGTGFRAPTTFYEYAHGVAPEGYRLLNDTHSPESSINANLSATLDLGRKLNAALECSWNRVRDPITVETTEQGYIRVFNADGELDVVSVEAQVQSQPLEWLMARTGYGYYHYFDEAGALVSAPPSHQINLGVDLSFDFGLKVSLAADVFAPMDLRKVYGLGYNIGVADPSLADWLDPANADLGSPKRERSPWYALINLRVEQRVYKWFSVYAGVDNLLDYHQSDIESPLFFPADADGNPTDADVVYIWGPLRGLFFYAGLKMEV